MKNKIISIMILLTIFMSMLSVLSKVKAYSGELDPENYITLPTTIWVENNIGTGTANVRDEGFSIAYQKVDISKETYDGISEKLNDYNALVKRYNSGESVTEDEINQKKNDYYNSIPNYTDSWKSTTNTQNNIKLDFSNYTETTDVYFILWIKAGNATNTYYDFSTYSSKIEKSNNETTNTPNTPGENEKPSGDWTDFSNAKFELKKDGISSALIEITGITGKNNNTYYIYISSTASKPDIAKISDEEKIALKYADNKFTTSNNEKVAKKIELNQDLYANVIEVNNSTGKSEIVSYGNKLERFEEDKYSNAFHSTFITNNGNQIITTFTHEKTNNRKMQIKIGKINNTTILNKLKNQNSSGFAELLKYAKENNGIYDKIVSADKDDNHAIEYNAGESYKDTENSLIELNGLKNGEYYFIYIKTEDEDGKYISNEAVTLAQANIVDNKNWGLFVYGSSDFKWADFGNATEDKDSSVAPGTIPQTGTKTIIAIGTIIVIAGIGIICYSKYKKYKIIK